MINLDFNENGMITACLFLRQDTILKHIKAKPSVISISSLFAKDREEVEAFIKDVYLKSYNAKIDVHYPILMSIRDEEGKILSAAGFRPASTEPLFLEQYLSKPVEDILQTPRGEIVEVGNLASNGDGGSLYLFTSLTAYLNYKGYTKIVVTSTNALERRFRQMGLNPQRHAKADPDLLLGYDEDWGRYYDTEPHVLSGSTKNSFKKLQENLGAEYCERKPKLFPRLHYKGEIYVA